MSETVLDDDFGALADFAETQEKTMLQNLISEEQNEQEPEEPGQSELIEKYKEFLVFKVYGKGAFGEVTEFYDIINREKVAKKVFSNITDYKVEREVMTRIDEALGKDLSDEIILGVSKYDAKNQTIFYRAGNCTLADLCNKRREEHLYWFNNEDELMYVACTLYDQVMKMAEKNVYHSDLKPVNTILIYNEKGLEQYDLKLIDMGGATFHWNYLVAITPTYFPEQDVFDANANQDNRIKAEIYQVGRIMQEVCLSSVYGKQAHLYKYAGFRTYKEFIKYYMANTQQMRDESLKLIKDYYSADVYDMVRIFLDYKEGVESCKTILEKLRPKAKTTFRDAGEYIKNVETLKMNQMFAEINRSEEKLYQELDFYMLFDFDERALKRISDELEANHKKAYEKEELSKFARLAFYEAIFKTRMQKYGDSILMEKLQKWEDEEKGKDSESSDSEDSDKDNFIAFDKKYNEKDTVVIPKQVSYYNRPCEVKSCFKHPSISDDLKLQFFCEVVGKTAHFQNYLEKEMVENIIKLLGFDDEDSPYEAVIAKYHKFFVKGSSQIYNDTLVKKTVKNLEGLIDEAETEEKKNILKGFIFQIRCLFVEACYKKMEEAITKKLDVLGVIADATRLFKEIKKSEYGKQMQFLQLAKGFYLLKKFEMENEKSEKSEDDKKKELGDVKEALEQCSRNMVKVGSPLQKYELKLYEQLAKLSNELGQEQEALKYEYLAMKNDSSSADRYIISKKWKELRDMDDKEKVPAQNALFKEYFDITGQWSGITTPNKQSFMAKRVLAIDKYLWGKDFVNNLSDQSKKLDELWKVVELNELQNQFVKLPPYFNRGYADSQWDSYILKWFKAMIEREKKLDAELFTKEMGEYEKQHCFDLFSCDFKLEYLALMTQQGLKNFKDGYEVIEYLRDKYIDYPVKCNEVTLLEMYMAAYEKNEKKYKKSQKELEKDEMTPIQKHSLQLLPKFLENYGKPIVISKEQDLENTHFYNDWRCPHCEKALKYMPNDDYWSTRQKELRCKCCQKDLANDDNHVAYPCYGCECKKEWSEYKKSKYKFGIYKEDMKRRKFEYNYYQSYYICLGCHAKPKNIIKRCEECQGPLQRIKDPYDNQHMLDGTAGFSCRGDSRVCYQYDDVRLNGHAYQCPKCTKTDKGKEWIYEIKPMETKYMLCGGCMNDIPDGYDMDPYWEKNPKEKANYDKKEKEIEKEYEKVDKYGEARNDIFCYSSSKYEGYDFQLCYDLFDNKYGVDWQKHYQEELNYKKNPSSKPKNVVYPQQQKKQQQQQKQQAKPQVQKKQQQQQQKGKPQQQQKQQQQKKQQQQQPKYNRGASNKPQQQQKRDDTACCVIF